MSALSRGAAALNSGLTAAMAVLHRLDNMGINVRGVEVRCGKPVMQIDPPPVNAFLRGAMRRRERRGNVQRTVIAASFHGAQLEWDAVRPVVEREPA